MTPRAFPVTYAAGVEAVVSFWELVAFRRPRPASVRGGEPGHVGREGTTTSEIGA
jgi:hypothetical protein